MRREFGHEQFAGYAGQESVLRLLVRWTSLATPATRPWWISHERRWVTFDLADARSKLAGDELVAAHYPTTRDAVNLVRNFRLAWTERSHWRPDVIISNGAAVAFPFFVIGRVKGIPTVYLEVYDRIDSRTLTGRLVRPFTTRFCVQWPEQQRLNPGSILVGPLY